MSGGTLAEINSFIDDAGLQYLHCTDENQRSETVRLSTVVDKSLSENRSFAWNSK